MSSSPSPSTENSGAAADGSSAPAVRVRGNTRSNLTGAWTIAILWNLISAPILYFVPREFERNPVAAIAFIFPIIGIGLLAWAVTLTLRLRRFGPAWFEMTPAMAGGACMGTVHIRLDRPGAGGMSSSGRLVVIVKLTCLRRVISSGKHRSVRENIVWREEEHVGQERILFTPAGAAIPVHIPLPADALPTTASKRSEGVFWALTVEASLPGIDLFEDFDIPVASAVPARLEESPPPAGSVIAQTARPPVTRHDLARSGIRIGQTEAGVEYHFGAARNPSFAFGVTAFLLLWTGALWVQIVLDAPWLFPLVSGLFELLLLLLVMDLWLGTTTVRIGSQTITRRHVVAGLASTREISAKDIVKIDLHISMQTTGRSGTPYYEIRATRSNGRRLSLGGGIRDKAHAEWLAGEMRQAVGLPS